ncbi:Mpo1-like protein [Leptospira ryugenii]|uniref:Mpo1-like protein n=1 Tax=Leptospira ryugenii TaxID=1917863 RepID=UPI000D5A0E10|nr:Mpo1-like protein [Leptospira ryugenii]
MNLLPKSFRSRFYPFYNEVYLPEHRDPRTVLFHVIGTVMGLVWIPFATFYLHPIMLVCFPIIHGLPGILAHRLFERNEEVGDLRINRKDYPNLWFVIANHIITFQLVFYFSRRKLHENNEESVR